jgi:3',5'-cyclic AMP phosphodiesterase CpdA
MRTLVHLSDPHFGRVDEALLPPLRSRVAALRPDVLVVSGDLTQRARSEQFRAARAYLDTLPGPQIIVPGNHDISLYNVFRRFVLPLERYKRYITDDLSPTYIDDEIAVLGVNTAHSLTFKDGRINHEQIDSVKAHFSRLPPGLTRIIVTHHPFDLPAHGDEKDLVTRAPIAMRAFAECGVDVLLSGHMHISHAANTSERYRMEGFAALGVHAGTATSTRGRGEVNSFNVLRIVPDRVEVERYGYDPVHGQFSVVDTDVYLRQGNVWTASTEGLFAAGI